MSGFEIAGIILGTIPVAISLAQEYRKAIHSWRKYDREVKSLILRLKTEGNILETHCEKLLNGIVSHAEIQPMIREPFGPLWKETHINDMARQRLWESYDAFEETVSGMQEAAEELTNKLRVNSSSQIRNDESSPRSWGLDRARYMIKRSQYNEFLEIIEDGNATLERLLNANIDPAVESNRRIRSGGRFLTIARNISRNVYIALSSSISCNCSVSHGVNLELLHPPSRPTPRDDDDLIASKMLFRLSLAYDPDLRDVKDTTWLWDEVELRVRRIEPQHPPGNMVAIPKASGKPRKTVQFSMKTATDAGRQSPQLSTTLLPAEMASLTVQASLGILNKTEQAPELSDLCQTIQRCQNQKDVQCYGYVSSPSAAEYHKFGVYPVRTEQDYSNWSSISLKNVLDNKASVPLLRFRDKQKLAAIIASNVLQHPGSSWLPDMVTSDDILFINRQGKELYEQAFVAKRLPETEAVEPPCNPMNSTDCIQNRMLFGLGIVLLEIALGITLDSLRGPSEQSLRRSPRNLLQDYKIAEEHLDMVKRSGGEDYGRAVQRCIRCEFLSRNHSLDDDEFRQEVYGTVVAPLEENVRAIQAGSKRFY